MPRPNPLDRFNCGPVKFSGGNDALYERHLTFGHVVPFAAATPRDRFEAVARSMSVLEDEWASSRIVFDPHSSIVDLR